VPPNICLTIFTPKICAGESPLPRRESGRSHKPSAAKPKSLCRRCNSARRNALLPQRQIMPVCPRQSCARCEKTPHEQCRFEQIGGSKWLYPGRGSGKSSRCCSSATAASDGGYGPVWRIYREAVRARKLLAARLPMYETMGSMRPRLEAIWRAQKPRDSAPVNFRERFPYLEPSIAKLVGCRKGILRCAR
jgi:hypothetical protein